VIAKINYGGRVIDENDEMFISTYIKKFINDEIAHSRDFSYDELQKYSIPD